MSQAMVFTRVLRPDPLTFKPARSLRNAMGNVFGTWGKRLQKCLEFIIVLSEIWSRLLRGDISLGDHLLQLPIVSFPPLLKRYLVANASLSRRTATKPSGELTAPPCPAATGRSKSLIGRDVMNLLLERVLLACLLETAGLDLCMRLQQPRWTMID